MLPSSSEFVKRLGVTSLSVLAAMVVVYTSVQGIQWFVSAVGGRPTIFTILGGQIVFLAAYTGIRILLEREMFEEIEYGRIAFDSIACLIVFVVVSQIFFESALSWLLYYTIAMITNLVGLL